jgi:hypothetical protein
VFSCAPEPALRFPFIPSGPDTDLSKGKRKIDQRLK